MLARTARLELEQTRATGFRRPNPGRNWGKMGVSRAAPYSKGRRPARLASAS